MSEKMVARRNPVEATRGKGKEREKRKEKGKGKAKERKGKRSEGKESRPPCGRTPH